MPSGDDSDDVVSERETQFVPRSDDDEVLWEVQEITEERGRKYKVKWAGINPATGKAWAQSWVAKHDCTDKLVVEWKAKKKRSGTKRDGRRRTTSRALSSSKSTGSATSGKKTRSSPLEATSSRLNSVEKPSSPLSKKSTTATAKRKRMSEPEAPGSVAVPTTGSSGAVRRGEEVDDESERPLKKQKVALEALLVPPISSDEELDPALLVVPEKARTKVTPRKELPPEKSSDAAANVLDDYDISPPPNAKGKGKEKSKLSRSKVVLVRRERIIVKPDTSSEDKGSGSSTSKKRSGPKPRSSSEQDDTSDQWMKSMRSPIKVGPPRGIKRREVSGESGVLGKSGPSRMALQEDAPQEEHVDAGASPGQPLLIPQDTLDNPISTVPSRHTSMPLATASNHPHSPDLSPGARARLELFDRMMLEVLQTDSAPAPADASKRVSDDGPEDHRTLDTFDPPRPLSPPPSVSKPKHSKIGTPNRLVVPETESSRISQSQPEPFLKSPQPPQARDKSPRRSIDLPTITLIASSSASSSVPSAQDLLPLPRAVSFSPNRPSKKRTLKPVPQISPNTFRSTIRGQLQVADSEAPPSSIESFASPSRADKGKQPPIEDDELKSSVSEEVGSGGGPKGRPQTDGELNRRGKELYEQALQRREAEKKKRKARQLRALDDIVNGTIGSQSMGSSLLLIGEVENSLPPEWVDLGGDANSTTLDTAEQSEARPLSEGERVRLRIVLRQEEEENTQEAMGVCPAPLVEGPETVNDRNTQISPPRSPMIPSLNGQTEVEQPSADLQLASIMVQASQEPRQDTEVELSQLNQQPNSSPPRPIPENLTDSPKRRLGEALSLLNVKSEEIERLERELADERKNSQNLKMELAEARKPSEPTGSIRAAWDVERAEWAQERSKWESDLSVWETQRKEWSNEKAGLSARVAELSDTIVRAGRMGARVSELEAEHVAWSSERDAMRNEITQCSEEMAVLTKDRKEHEEDRTKWETERVLWAEERTGWETERAALQEKQESLSRSVDELTARVESVTAAKVSAEKDKEFFREQYAQASGFVGSVREENAELEKRVQIAEGQAREGVAAIRVMFEGRVKALQADIDRWKGLSELLQEKDKRTTDKIRQHAAQLPELQELCDRFRAENRSLEADVRKLSKVEQRHAVRRQKMYHEIYVLKKERTSLKSRLLRLAKIAESSTQESGHAMSAPPVLQHQEQDPDGSLDPNDMMDLPVPTFQSSCANFDEPFWFPCMWRPQLRDQCQCVFDTKEDLERHVQQHFCDLSTQ